MHTSELDQSIAAAAAVIEAGGVVAYPTETVYGLGVDAGSDDALGRLRDLKTRDTGKGISVLVGDLAGAERLVAGAIPDEAVRLARAFWPGPLTIVLPAAADVPRCLVGDTGGIGLRCSSDAVCARLVCAFGRPITSTSANPAGLPPAVSVEEARAYFGRRVNGYVDGGVRTGMGVSTVVEFRDGCAYLRRDGAVSAEALSSILPLENGAPRVR